MFSLTSTYFRILLCTTRLTLARALLSAVGTRAPESSRDAAAASCALVRAAAVAYLAPAMYNTILLHFVLRLMIKLGFKIHQRLDKCKAYFAVKKNGSTEKSL